MISFSRTWAVMAKEFIQLTRDRLTYAMILVMPVVQLLLFGYAINNDPRAISASPSRPTARPSWMPPWRPVQCSSRW